MRNLRGFYAKVSGTVLGVLWLIFWTVSFYLFRLALAKSFAIPARDTLGLDFFHNYKAVNFWLSGGNPYVDTFGDSRGFYAYPPIVLSLYSWCGFFSLRAATLIWTVAIAAILVWGTYVTLRLKNSRIAVLPFALILWSTPTVFAMERGNGDALVLAGILAAVALFRIRSRLLSDGGIGLIFAVASWVKIYPLVLLFSLLPLRKWRAFGLGVVALVLIGFLSRVSLVDWLVAMKQSQVARLRNVSATLDWVAGCTPTGIVSGGVAYPPLRNISHSLSSSWPVLMGGVLGEDSWLARIPGLLAAILIFGVSLLIVGLKILKSKTVDSRLVLAWWLWAASVATFVMPVSFDYNLIYFPVLLLLLYTNQLPKWVRYVFFLQFVWWFPLGILASNKVLMAVKLLGIFCTGVVLYRHESYMPAMRSSR